MDMLRSALTVSPETAAALQREQLRWQERANRIYERSRNAAARIEKAEAKRQRKRLRNIAILDRAV